MYILLVTFVPKTFFVVLINTEMIRFTAHFPISAPFPAPLASYADVLCEFGQSQFLKKARNRNNIVKLNRRIVC